MSHQNKFCPVCKMEAFVKLNQKTAGRDKLARLIQYSSRTLWYAIQQYHSPNSKYVDKLKSTEYTFSTFRKMLRFGRFLDFLYVSMKPVNHPDPMYCCAHTLANISHAMFLFCDHIIWLGRAGFCDVNSQKWFSLSNKYWLYSIILNLVKDYVELKRILQPASLTHFNLMIKSHKQLVLDIIKNICDVFIPLAAIGILEISPGKTGILGIMSTLAGISLLFNS